MITPFSRDHPYFYYRVTILISLIFVTPFGFISKFYRGPGAWWFNDYIGGFLYDVFWILLITSIWPKISPYRIALGVFLVTSFLEFLQLWHPPFLQLIRSTFLGRALIGTSFTWWDFPYYFLGCALGLFWVRYIKNKTVFVKSV